MVRLSADALTYEQAMARLAELEAKLQHLQAENERLRAVNRLSQQVSASLNIEQVLDAVLAQIAQMLSFDSATLLLVEEDRLRAVAARGFSSEAVALNVYPRSSQNSAWRVVQQKTPLVIADVQTVAGWENRHGIEKIRAWMGVPLIAKEEVVGVLTLDSHRPNTYSPADADLIFGLSHQIAIAVENASLFERVKTQRDQMSKLQALNQAIGSILDLDTLLQVLMEQIAHMLGSRRCSLWLFDETGKEAVVRAWYGVQTPDDRTITRFDVVRHPIIQKMLTGNQPLILDRVTPDLQETVWSDSSSALSLLVMPLRGKEKNIGFIVTDNTEKREAFLADRLTLAMNAANQAALSIENARLFGQIQRYSQDLKEAVIARTVHLTAVNEISRAISSIVTMDELFDKVTRLISELFNQARVSVALRTGNYLTLQRTYDGELEANTVPENHRLPIRREHILGRVLLSGEADFIETVETAELYRLKACHEAPTTALVVPLTIGGKTIGVIVVQSRSWLASQQQDMETLQALASQVAVAMENARLLQKSREMATIQERTRLARDMHDGIAQNLAYLLLQVDRALSMVESGSPKLESQLENISSVIAQNIEELRRHIFNLRPIGLEGGSVYKVFRQMAGEFTDRFGIQTHFETSGPEIDLRPEVESSLYRILQEALSNIHRHARCTEVWLSLKTSADGMVVLSIRDNGVGFDPARISRRFFRYHGLGLISMQERVRNLGGTLTIDSAPGKGTRILVHVPNL